MTQALYYVYILESIENSARHYVGFTENMGTRLKDHNRGHVPHTSKNRQWQVRVCMGFMDRDRALDFEKYLKSHSGRAFSQKHL